MTKPTQEPMGAFKNALPLLFWICCVAVNVYSVWLFVVY